MILSFDFLKEVTFLQPYFFLLIFLYVFALYFFREKIPSFYFSNLSMIPNSSRYKSILIKILQFLMFFFMIVALANPIKEDEIVVNTNKGYEISIILDASISMLENKKFTITKEILADFMKQRTNDRIALSVFADYPYLLAPMTYNKEALSKLLEFLEVGVAGQRETAVYEALFFSTNLFKGSTSKNKIAILITDGIDNTNTVPLNIAIQKAKDLQIKVYTIGIGNAEDYNKEALEKIALQTNAQFFQAKSKNEMKQIYKAIEHLEKSEIKIDRYKQKTYFYQYPLFVSFGLLVIFLMIRGRYL